MSPPPKPPGKRQALANRGGAITCQGDASAAADLQRAWEAGDEDPDRLTHGFHSYPARMHPAVARELVAAVSRRGDVVLDPFCGGGTVLVEAMVAGRVVHGVDLNPVAVAVARVRCERRDGPARERFSKRLQAVADASLERVAARARSRAPLSPAEREFYDPHVLRELGGLYEEIRGVTPREDREALGVLLCSMVVKFSRQRADTSPDAVPKRIGKRMPTRFFARKGDELVTRWAALHAACEHALPRRPRIVEGDARELPRVLPRGVRVQAIVCSPPYGGTYDYAEHHARRYPWLGVSPTRLRADEIGARRHLSATRRGSGVRATRRWDDQVGQMLAAMSRVLAPDGRIALVTGDAQVGGRRVDTVAQLRGLAPAAGLVVVASASQPRPDFGGGPPRREHIVLLAPGGPT